MRQTDINPFGAPQADYEAAKSNKFRRRRTGLSSMGSGADWHLRSNADFYRIMEYARDMDRNEALIGQMVDRAVSNTIQEGIKLDPNTGDKKLDALLLEMWQEWANDPDECDIAGELDFNAMESLILRQALVDGDIVALPLKTGSLEIIEAHRIRTPQSMKNKAVLGVLLNDTRRRLQYWIAKNDISISQPLAKVSEIHRIPVRDSGGNRQIFHIYLQKRASQTRGVSAFAAIFNEITMHGDIQYAQLIKSQVAASFVIIHQRPLGAYQAGGGTIGEKTNETLPDGETRTIQGIGPGLEITGAEGEELKGFSPNVPNQEYFQHSKLILQIIGANLGLPLGLVLLDASDTNFSGWRGAIDQARLGFRRNQKWMISRFHKPVYRWKIRQWMAEDPKLAAKANRSTINIFGHNWNPPTWPYIEPFKDAQADALKLEKNLTSPRRLQNDRGRDWDKVHKEIVVDRSKLVVAAIEATEEINTKYPSAKLDWRTLAGVDVKSLPPPGGEPNPKEDDEDANVQKSRTGT